MSDWYKPWTWADKVLSNAGPEEAPAQAPKGAPSQCGLAAAKTDPTARKVAAKRALSTPKSDYQLQMPKPEPLHFDYENGKPLEAKADDKGKMTGKDWAGVGLGGASVLGGILAALGEDDPDARAYDLPGASGPDALALGGVDKPFTGRMDMTPEQRQSLALAMLR